MFIRNYSGKEKAAALLLLLTNLLVLLSIWLEKEYDQVFLDQILFQLKSSSTGVNNDLLGSAILHIGVFSAVLMILEVWLYQFLSGRRVLGWFKLRHIPRSVRSSFPVFVKKKALSLAAAMLTVAILLLGAQLDVYAFVKTATAESEFIQDHYVDPDDVDLLFPEQKRNLVYIFLESMESTYADPAAGEQITACYIPELETLAEENLSFSHRDGLGGALSYPGTTWTAAAMVAQTSGVAVKVSLGADTYGGGEAFLPGATSIGDILEDQGYRQILLLGSNAKFHGREAYFTEHGNYEILDTVALKEAGRLPEDYNEWWGYEDEKLFSYAREELTRLAKEGAPFNLTMLTADTHFPDGCHCSLCEDIYDAPYANVLACSSRQVAEFVAWTQEQPFYENTTIVISGDHLTMDGGFMDGIDPEYTRTVYNCFIHAPTAPVREKNRQFGTFDLFPTTLGALGVEIEGDRLALGTNLFSDRQTLTEEFGYGYLAEELQKQSDFYDAELLQMERKPK